MTAGEGVAIQLVTGSSKDALSAGAKASVDHLARRRISMKRDESPCCVTRDLVPGVSLAVFKDPKPTLDAAEAEATRAQWPKFGIAGALSLVIVAVALLSNPGEEIDAQVREVSPVADPATRTYQVKATLPNAPARSVARR